VTRFVQESDHLWPGCRGWEWGVQNQLQTELESKLRKQGLRVLERRSLNRIYESEFQHPNLKASSKPRTKQMMAAQFTVTGGIAELGICEESSGTDVQLGGIVGLLGGPSADLAGSFDKVVSRVRMIANLVKVETAETLETFEAEGTITDEATRLRGEIAGIGLGGRAKSRPAIEKASTQAIQKLAEQISTYLSRL
jgi:curli biogenesis system outer membrane secretion channel CsgG